jgi:hypothetical protein
MKDFEKLSRAEMKNVLGGDDCYDCVIVYPNAPEMIGQSCGTDFQNAGDNLTTNILNHPDAYGSPSYWSCQNH